MQKQGPINFNETNIKLGFFIENVDDRNRTLTKIMLDEKELARYVEISAILLDGDFPRFKFNETKINLIRCDEKLFHYPFPLASYCFENNLDI